MEVSDYKWTLDFSDYLYPTGKFYLQIHKLNTQLLRNYECSSKWGKSVATWALTIICTILAGLFIF